MRKIADIVCIFVDPGCNNTSIEEVTAMFPTADMVDQVLSAGAELIVTLHCAEKARPIECIGDPQLTCQRRRVGNPWDPFAEKEARHSEREYCVEERKMHSKPSVVTGCYGRDCSKIPVEKLVRALSQDLEATRLGHQ